MARRPLRTSGLFAIPPAWQQVLLFLALLVPAISEFWAGAQGELGANPVEAAERDLGLWAFRLLLLTLALAPIKALTGISLLRSRRTLGLLAFTYAALHLLVYVWLDQGFDMPVLLTDVTKRPFVIIGFLAFLVLLALATTSTKRAIRAMGRRWKPLHRLVYPASILIAIHFALSFKTWRIEPLFYAIALVALLGWRVARHRRAGLVRKPARAGASST